MILGLVLVFGLAFSEGLQVVHNIMVLEKKDPFTDERRVFFSAFRERCDCFKD